MSSKQLSDVRYFAWGSAVWRKLTRVKAWCGWLGWLCACWLQPRVQCRLAREVDRPHSAAAPLALANQLPLPRLSKCLCLFTFFNGDVTARYHGNTDAVINYSANEVWIHTAELASSTPLPGVFPVWTGPPEDSLHRLLQKVCTGRMSFLLTHHQTTHCKGSDTLESFLSKVAFQSNLQKKLSRIEHVLIVKVSFERRKIAKVFMTRVQVFFRKSLSKATFQRKLSGVSLS